MGEAAIATPAPRWTLRDLAMALSVALTMLYGVLVEYLGLLMIRADADQKAFMVLGLFAMPLLTSWAAIAIWVATRPPWLRWTAAALLLLAPPLILLGFLNA